MRQFELDDVLRAAAGDADALLRVQRRKDVLKWNAQARRTALQYATPSWADHQAIDAVYTEARRLSAETGIGEPAEFGKNRTLRFSGHP